MKKIFLNLFLFMAAGLTQAQVTTNGGAGLAASYPTLGDAITALNAATINSKVVITVIANQTAPAGGYTITAEGNASDSIILDGSGATITASASQAAGSLTDGIFKLVGADFVTIKNFTLQENSANTTVDIATNNMTEWAIAVLYNTATNGARHNLIQNNIISLNGAYPNSFGIYSSTAHTSTDALTVADITAATGGNDSLKLYQNTISNVNIPIAVIGSPGFPGAGLDIGGTGSATGNTASNWGFTALYSAFARVDNQVNASTASGFYHVIPGILAVNEIAPNISYNALTSNNSGNADGLLAGIYLPANGTITYPGTPYSTSITNNIFALSTAVSGSTTTVPLINAIRVATGDANNTININYNNITGITHTANALGSDTLIYNLASPLNLNINYNQFSNLSFSNSGAVAAISIHGRVFMPVNGTQNVNYNSITGSLSRTCTLSSVGSTIMISRGIIPSGTASDGSEAGSAFVAQYNNFSNFNGNGGAFTGITNFDGKQGLATLSKTITHNTFSNINTSVVNSASTYAGSIYVIQFTNRGAVHTVSNNTIDGLNAAATTSPATSAGSINGIFFASGTTDLSFTVDGNIFQNFSGSTVSGFNGPTAASITNNKFLNFTGWAGTGTSAVTGINMSSIPANALVTVSGNKIGNFSDNYKGNGTVAGINLSTTSTNALTLKINNNLIGDLRADSSTTFNAINGMIIGAGIISSEIVHNTVYLAATSSSTTTFGTSCILFNTTTNSDLILKNNILYNLSTPAQNAVNSGANGIVAVIRRNSGAIGTRPANYDNSSNNNLIVVNPTAGTNNHLSYVEGITAATITNPKNTLADLQAFLTPADQASVTETTTGNPFLSLVASDNNFLHINPAIISAASNAGMPIASITIDYDGDSRSATTPDIGADEYNQNIDAVALPVSLVMFNGYKSGSNNILTWLTITEINNKGFDVERSSDGNKFSTIGFIQSRASNGNSNGRLEYNFTDRNVPAGNFYYRLVQKDLNGAKKLSNVVLITDVDNNANGAATVYPNPVRSQLGITMNATQNNKASFIITDINGKTIRQMNTQVVKGSNSFSLDVSGLPVGVYTVTIYINEPGKTITTKFMKQ